MKINWTIFTITVILTAICALSFHKKATAEITCQECENIVNSIFEIDMRNELHPPLSQIQILELNNICEQDNVTEDDIREIAPQFYSPTEGLPKFIYEETYGAKNE